MPPAGSVAAAVYTVLLADTPSFTESVLAELITGARSLTLIVTAWVSNSPDGSLALTVKLYEFLVSKSGVLLTVTAPVRELTVNAEASVPESE